MIHAVCISQIVMNVVLGTGSVCSAKQQYSVLAVLLAIVASTETMNMWIPSSRPKLPSVHQVYLTTILGVAHNFCI